MSNGPARILAVVWHQLQRTIFNSFRHQSLGTTKRPRAQSHGASSLAELIVMLTIPFHILFGRANAKCHAWLPLFSAFDADLSMVIPFLTIFECGLAHFFILVGLDEEG